MVEEITAQFVLSNLKELKYCVLCGALHYKDCTVCQHCGYTVLDSLQDYHQWVFDFFNSENDQVTYYLFSCS